MTLEDPHLNARIVEESKKCEDFLNSTTEPSVPGSFCPGIFDGWSCWPPTNSGTWASQHCPEFITGLDPTRLAFKECLPNGTWFVHPVSLRTWSNYTTCVNVEDLEYRQHINLVYSIGYTISLIALIISLAVLTYFKSLRCARITVHMNLFSSFAINNLLWLIWYGLVVGDPQVAAENTIGCQILHVILHYFLVSNYCWMLCEGLYLHTVLVSAFISENRLVRWMLLLGWGMPFAAVCVYAPVRSLFPEETTQCWMNDSVYKYILMVPVILTVVLNVFFLINIVRVLYNKLRKGPQGPEGPTGASRTALQALRATLLLVPLLGLNFLLTPFRPEVNSPWEQPYEVLSAITASLQGLCVAILFCFCNGEVIAQVKRKYRNTMFRPRANSCTLTTVSVSRKQPIVSNSKATSMLINDQSYYNVYDKTPMIFVRSTPCPVAGEEKV